MMVVAVLEEEVLEVQARRGKKGSPLLQRAHNVLDLERGAERGGVVYVRG